MDQLRAQLGNYLEWLESRGLTGTVAFRAPTDAPPQPGLSETQDLPLAKPEQQQADMEKSNAIPARAPEVPNIVPHRVAEEIEADARSAAALRSAAVSAPSAAAPAIESNAAQRESVTVWKVGFYSSSDLTEEEFIMVSKIALALGLPVEDFKIWAEDSLVHVPVDLLRCSYIVALGPGSGQTLLALGQTVAMNSIQKALQGAPLLTIPHPRAMLREPTLKGGAWTALQKFKALMTP